MSVVAKHGGHSASPPGCPSGGAGPLSPDVAPLQRKQDTPACRSGAHTTPVQCPTQSPGSFTQHFQPSDNAATGRGAEDEGELHHGEPQRPVGVGPPPSLAGIGSASSCSAISSHNVSFGDSLAVRHGEKLRQQRLCSVPPRRAFAQTHSSPSLVDAPPHLSVERSDGVGPQEGGGGVEGKPAAPFNKNPSRCEKVLPIRNPKSATLSRGKPRGRDNSLAAPSPTTARSPLRRHVTSPESDIRTLRSFLTWRSQLPKSQRSSCWPYVRDAPATRNPRSTSAPATSRRRSESSPSQRPVALPVADSVLSPTPNTRTTVHALHSLPPLCAPISASVVGVKATPASRRRSCDDGASQSARQTSGAIPLSTGAAASPPRLACKCPSRSEYEDSFSSSSCSHITSPATIMQACHASSLSCNSSIGTNGGASIHDGGGISTHSGDFSAIRSTPVMAPGTRPVTGKPNSSSNSNFNSNEAKDASMEWEGRNALPELRPGGTPLLPAPTAVSGLGIENQAPRDARSTGLSHPPTMSLIRHNLANHGSDLSASLNGAPMKSCSPAVSQNLAYRIPASRGRGRDESSRKVNQPSVVEHPHPTKSSVIMQMSRGLVLEEYPAFATPLDDDTNKAVVGLVTLLLLVLCLGFIFSI
ncbi:hypothetical protein ABL78_3421 [Leptomonas seymouri]|uniref:Uncharacterized protein n=1 Tax=Leptomonas seymouri TaxID=5684 RepID=A0A0N1HXZ6_LEPSE|nr:hypothetical protein ABL78_3421 [Leptomonas seymouri]|eukprot:KPI87510.1 hypothetical protein ABL78_3421 [Leptomonas seymouri]